MTNLKLVEDRLEEISFPLVSEHPLLFTTGTCLGDSISGDAEGKIHKMQTITSHKGITDHEDNNIAVVGIGYTVVQNDGIFRQIEDAIYSSPIDTTGMVRKIRTSHLGARTVVTYMFPAHTIEIADGDDVMLTIRVLNSYDGSWRLMTLVGAVREVCKNGMVIGEYFSESIQKHTKNIDTDVAVQKLSHALEVFIKTSELWTQYPSTPVSDLQATNVLMSLAGGSKTLLELLQQTHVRYVDELGKNLWSLFNTLTDWSSHAKFKNEKNKAATIINRESRVRKVLPMIEAIRKAA